jgi:hypothetical protein
LGQPYLENQRNAARISSDLRSQEWRYFFSNCTRLRSFGLRKEGEEAHQQREAFPLCGFPASKDARACTVK